MFGKMYIASVDSTPEGDLITLSSVAPEQETRRGTPPPASQRPAGERPAVYGGGTGSLGAYDDRPPAPAATLQLTGDLSFVAPPNATVKSGQVYLVSLTPSEGETIPVEGEPPPPEESEGAKKRK